MAITRQAIETRFPIGWSDRYPCLDDKTKTNGFDRHYLYHPAWAARILAITRPLKHVDFSSTLNFATMLSAFIPVSFYYFRPVDVRLTDLTSLSANLVTFNFVRGMFFHIDSGLENFIDYYVKVLCDVRN